MIARKEEIYDVIPRDVLSEIFEGFELDIEDGIHGFSHWSRVIDNGMFLAEENGANKKVLIAFGLFHDVKRENDNEDPEHGYRGGLLIDEYRDRINLTSEEVDKVIEACSGHTDELHDDDLDIGTCWDSDRLDLYRVGVYPDPDYLNNEFAMEDHVIEERSELAEYEEMSPWAHEIVDDLIAPMIDRRLEEKVELSTDDLMDIIDSKKEAFNPWVDNGETIKIKLYHGTTEDKVSSIRKDGLISPVNDPNWYMLSTNFGGALYHSNADESTDAVVLEMEIELPKPVHEVLWNGHQQLHPPYKHDNKDVEWYALSEKISPESIKKVHRVDFDSFLEQKRTGFDDLDDYQKETLIVSSKRKNKLRKN